MQHEAKELDGAVKTLYQTFQLGQDRGVQFASLAAVAHLAYILILRGQLEEAAELCRRAINQAVDRFGKPLPSAGIAHIGLGTVYYEANDLEQAKEHLSTGLELSRQLAPLIGFSRYGHIWQAKLQQALGQEEGALATIQQARQVELGIRQFSFASIFAAAEAGLQLRQGNLDAAASWAAEADLSLTAPPEYFGGMEYLAFARLLLAQGCLDEAQTLLADYERAATAEERHGSLITIHILQSLVAKELGQEDRAMAYLERAVALAEPQSYRRRFLDEGSKVAELLPRVRHVAPDFVDELLALFADPASSQQRRIHAGEHTEAATTAAPELVEPLSKREIEVLRLVARGLSNREIAQALYVTVGTVKKHLNNIFGKLEVGNRTQAAARARELRLLR
jgi:LuxR family maltose regulon positive regulatory protein